MDKKTNSQRIDQLEAKINSTWYKRVEIWSLIISIVALIIASILSNSANEIARMNNILEQSSIRSQHINYCYQLINELADELKTDSIISPQFVTKFTSHTHFLQPFIQDIEDRNHNYIITSPGRGLLVNALFKMNINKLELKNIYSKSNFESASLIDIEWDSVTIYSGKMSKSYLQKAKILNSVFDSTDFNGSIINDSKLDFSTIINQTTFNQCVIENTSLKGCEIKNNVEFCGLMKYVDSKNVENFSQICKYEYKKNEKSILREL